VTFDWTWCLAHNLAIGAGLYQAHEWALESAFTYCEHWMGCTGWRPGCNLA